MRYNVRMTQWPETIEEARKVQEALRERVRIRPLTHNPRTVAAMDASYTATGRRGRVLGVACLFTWPDLEPLEEAVAIKKTTFPYVPGYLSFREGPVLAEAIGSLTRRPGLLMFDGQGIAHPLGLGIASHLGVVLGLPSIGCAKSRLVGEYEETGPEKGARSVLVHKGRPVGAVVRTRTGVRPVFVSPGHRVSLEEAVEMVLAATGRYRLPEPLRRAHLVSLREKNLLK
jgi:deoxyribonuclease V